MSPQARSQFIPGGVRRGDSFDAHATGLHRIADDTIALYELYRGVDADADLDAAPWETFASLPHETAVLAADHVYHLVTRLRNAWDLLSANIAETLVEIDAGGDEVSVPPSGPDEVALSAAAAGTVLVEASYHYAADGDDAATKWLIYLTDDGSAPDPDVDVPTVVDMVLSDGTARLDWTSGAYADGTTIKVIVRTRRIDAGPVNVDSTDTDIHTTEADTDGPAAPDPSGIHFDSVAEQSQ